MGRNGPSISNKRNSEFWTFPNLFMGFFFKSYYEKCPNMVPGLCLQNTCVDSKKKNQQKNILWIVVQNGPNLI